MKGISLTMKETNSRAKYYLRTVHELLFSIYFSVVVLSAEETMGSSWAFMLRSYYVLHHHPGALGPIHDPRGERFILFLLAWLLAAGIFALRLALSRFSVITRFLSFVEGVVILGGLPLALIYTGYGFPLYLEVLLLLSIAYVFLYVYGKWLIPTFVNISFLVFLFSLSAWLGWVPAHTFPLGFYILLPDWDWVFGTLEWTKLIYPLLGSCAAVIWALYVKCCADGRVRQP